jgi:T5SS/PEP-CTERM-associated repeat protein
MTYRPRGAWGFFFILSGSVIFAGTGSAATVNNWTNTGSGLWSTPVNWSSNQAPDSIFDQIAITNSGIKTVSIGPGTPVANLSIQRLLVSAPAGSTNRLELSDLTTNQPLQLSSTLTMGLQGVLRIANSAAILNSLSGGIVDVRGGAIHVDSGLLDCGTTTAGKIGNTGGNGVLNINGGTVLDYQLQFGAASGSQGILNLSNGVLNSASLLTFAQSVDATGVANIAGGELIATNDITRVANLGTGQMNIIGGSATFAFLSIGENFTSSGIVNLSGGQLIMRPRTTNDWLRVGNLGNGQLNISGGTAFVPSELHLADDITSTGTVFITGGQLIATNDITAIGRHGTGRMNVSNAFVLLTNVSVGRHDGAIGMFELQNNAQVFLADALSIGRFANSVGHVLVGGGLLSLTSDTIWVGREGNGDMSISNGTVRAASTVVAVSTVTPDPNTGDPVTNTPSGSLVLAGGSLQLSSSFLVGTEFISTGQVAIVGGNLLVTNVSNTATLGVGSGTFTLSQGTVTADKLILTNGGTGQMIFDGGTLRARSASIANGAPFVVGNGTAPATFQLLGGTYSFANGLVISSNATVTGCGTIIGNISNFGTLSTNCTPSFSASNITKTGNIARVFFPTLAGSNYFLEYKILLSDPNWIAISPGVTGNGQVMFLADTNATTSTRFYRVHLQ